MKTATNIAKTTCPAAKLGAAMFMQHYWRPFGQQTHPRG